MGFLVIFWLNFCMLLVVQWKNSMSLLWTSSLQWIAHTQAVFYYTNTEKYAHTVNILSTLSVYLLYSLELNCMSSVLCASSLMLCICGVFQLSPDYFFSHCYFGSLCLQCGETQEGCFAGHLHAHQSRATLMVTTL